MELNTILLDAAAGSSAAGSGMTTVIMLVVIFAVMYFLMIRPQQKRQKELNQFRASLQKGMSVITAGGIYGKIKEIKDKTVVVEVDNNVNLTIDKTMILRDQTDTQAR